VKAFLDRELGGHAMVFDGVLDLLEQVGDADAAGKIPHTYFKAKERGQGYFYFRPSEGGFYIDPHGEQTSRKHLSLKSFSDYKEIVKCPWPEAVDSVKKLVQEIKDSGRLPEPASLKRKRRMKEEGDELDIDSALRGEKEFYIGTARTVVKGPRSVAIITNLDAGGGWTAGVFNRSVSAIAVSDILEAAGYSVEIWAWCLGSRVYRHPTSAQFSCTCVKASGAPMDLDALCDSLSLWITYQIIFASFAVSPFGEPKCIGGMERVLGPWEKYMQVSENVIRLYQPKTYSMKETLDSAVDMLTKVERAQRGETPND
jgi:hypothetical protein